MPKTFPAISASKVIRAVPAVPLTGIVSDGLPHSPAISIEKRGVGSYVPPAQQQRILHRHLMGESMRRISREEHRDFRTIAKVIRNNPARLKEHLEAGRALFYALTTQALETIRLAMEDGDAQLAYRLLTDAGVVPKPGETPSLMGPADSESPETSARKKYAAELVDQAMERAADYPLPSESIYSPSRNHRGGI
jgi:hypothetical protein